MNTVNMFIVQEVLEADLRKLKAKENLSDADKTIIAVEEKELELFKHIGMIGDPSIVGCTLEKFKEELQTRTNMVLMSDEEYNTYLKIRKIYNILKSIPEDVNLPLFDKRKSDPEIQIKIVEENGNEI